MTDKVDCLVDRNSCRTGGRFANGQKRCQVCQIHNSTFKKRSALVSEHQFQSVSKQVLKYTIEILGIKNLNNYDSQIKDLLVSVILLSFLHICHSIFR
jgi:hypothetical protein